MFNVVETSWTGDTRVEHRPYMFVSYM